MWLRRHDGPFFTADVHDGVHFWRIWHRFRHRGAARLSTDIDSSCQLLAMQPQAGRLRPELAPDEATERAKKALARHPIPVILLARLAVDVSLQPSPTDPYHLMLIMKDLRRIVAAADAAPKPQPDPSKPSS